MKIFIIFLLLTSSLFSNTKIQFKYNNNNFINFLKENKLPDYIYYSLSTNKQKLLSILDKDNEITIISNKNKIKTVKINLNDDINFNIYYDKTNKEYFSKIETIQYKIKEKKISLVINENFKNTMFKKNMGELYPKIINQLNNKISLKYLKNKTKIIMLITTKEQNNKIIGKIKINSLLINKEGNKNFYFYNDNNDEFYNKNGILITKNLYISKPIKNCWISSYFNKKRFHPVLHRFKKHDGIDYASKMGEPIYSAAKGTIIYERTNGGYGKMIKIKHKNGYMTLYAHMSRYSKLKVGDKVDIGQIIGYVGNTGLSTGPHLHFALYKNGKAINPNTKIKISDKIKKQELSKFKIKVKKQIKKLIS